MSEIENQSTSPEATETPGARMYFGFKIVKGTPMTRLAYNELRCWTVPVNENPDDEGYLVEYLDGGKANVPGFEGYVSWSPKEVFENAYKPSGSMTFGMALEAIKEDARVARVGWNGKGMWIALVKDWNGSVLGTSDDVIVSLLPWIGMKTADSNFVPWLASQTDMLAEDWMIVL